MTLQTGQCSLARAITDLHGIFFIVQFGVGWGVFAFIYIFGRFNVLLFIFNVFQMQTCCLFIVDFSKIRIEILILVEVCVYSVCMILPIQAQAIINYFFQIFWCKLLFSSQSFIETIRECLATPAMLLVYLDTWDTLKMSRCHCIRFKRNLPAAVYRVTTESCSNLLSRVKEVHLVQCAD